LALRIGRKCAVMPSWTFWGEACTSACIFSSANIAVESNRMVLRIEKVGSGYQKCNCPCEDMVKIKRPSALIMTLGYFAQSTVVVIVGINMSLR
jgi:hypothetical protein